MALFTKDHSPPADRSMLSTALDLVLATEIGHFPFGARADDQPRAVQEAIRAIVRFKLAASSRPRL